MEPLYLDAGLRELPSQPGIDNDDKIAGLGNLVALLHKSGAKAIAHLNRPGRMVNPKIPGNYFWSSTDEACKNGGVKPEEKNREMMDKVIDIFVAGAKRAVISGFDFIELQFGHGYLLAQFISPPVNKRTNGYNGDLKNHAKFPLEVLAAVKKAVNISIIARISSDEIIPEGLHIEEMIEFSKMLEKSGVAAIHVSAGSSCSTPPWFFQHISVTKGKTWELANRIKTNINIPIIFVGQVNTKDDILLLEQKYHAEHIALGRAMVADPEFVGKVTCAENGNIRPCMACSDGCLGNVKKGKGLGCVVNPKVNNEMSVFKKTEKHERIAVISGGLAGMQSAIVLKERGFDVTIFEKNKLGGQFNLAFLSPKKESLKKIVDYYTDEISRLKIPVIYKEAKQEDIYKGNFNQVVVA